MARRGTEAHSPGRPPGPADYETIGTYIAVAIAHDAWFYEIENLLMLRRGTPGEGAEVIANRTRQVLEDEFGALLEDDHLDALELTLGFLCPVRERGESQLFPAGLGPGHY